jgi:6-phosphogluconolactonase
MSSSDESTRDPQTLTNQTTRRQFLSLIGAATTIAAVAPAAFADGKDGHDHDRDHDHGGGKGSKAVRRYVYVGTYTAPNLAPGGTVPSTAVGIYVFKMDPHDGGLDFVQAVDTPNPSFLAIDPAQKYLYATNELGPGTVPAGPGRFSAWAINQANGMLSFINDVDSHGDFPAHLSVHPSGKYLLGSNYGTVASPGNFPIYQIMGDGSIGANTDTFQDTANGTGPNPARQDAPHAHMILTDPGVNHVFGVDLGTDKVLARNLNLTDGTISLNTVHYANVSSGSGCRHMAFHPSKNFAYVLNELVSSIDAFSYDPTRGAFIWLQTISTLPRNFTGTNTTAEIRVHQSGKWVYATNRGHNTVAIFEVHQKTGKLSVVDWESTRGEIPRGMNIDPSGTFLYAGNQNSDSIAVFRVNQSNGKLNLSELVQTPVPVDIEFGPKV